MTEEACDCSPEFCKTKDTSYNIHLKNSCVHLDGTSHTLDNSKNHSFLQKKDLDIKKIN